tara:strand:+ start:729 stop:863 length:135 start_codon:yes stop_codon:yes gene_type:complete
MFLVFLNLPMTTNIKNIIIIISKKVALTVENLLDAPVAESDPKR